MRGISNHKSGDNKENKNPDVAKAKESKFGKQPRRCVWTTRNYQIAKMVQHHTARCTKSNKINADYLPVRLRTQQCAIAPIVATTEERQLGKRGEHMEEKRSEHRRQPTTRQNRT